ncbi:MarR family winged helix-turn-helix transcriptional regulator [Calidifontibacter terrae]
MQSDDRANLSAELRMACMRISRRTRFENVDTVAPHQFSVLCKVREEAMTLTQLAESECVSGPSMTRTVAALADAALVERVPDEKDRRRTWVQITAAGEQAVIDTKASRDRWMQKRVEELSDAECEVLAQATEILTRALAR